MKISENDARYADEIINFVFGSLITLELIKKMYPPLLMLQPKIAKSLLEYRFERLEAAKQNAFSHGYKGAMFPWESAGDGSEDTPVWALTGPFEHHISGCVSWAFWKYFQVTKDTKWLKEKGYQVILIALVRSTSLLLRMESHGDSY